MSKPAKKPSKTLDATIVDIGHRLDTLIKRGNAEGVWPEKILDTEFVLASMFPDGQSSPVRTLVLTYLRLEPVLRFLEENLLPELDDRKAKSAEKDTADAAAPH